jgi:von Willebrand factor type A domain
MRKPSALQITLAASAVLVAIAVAAPRHGAKPITDKPTQRHVDLVIALDTSSSMDGLIDAARQKLWDTVNLLNQAQPRPVLRVGIVSYGNTGYDASAGWVRKDADLSTDLDTVYSKLFALKTNGGEEYVARAVDAAVSGMQWDGDPDALKIVFVAGNEPADQDPVVPLGASIGRARERGIFVNSIYCGSASAGEVSGWRQVASLGMGKFAAIDQNRAVAIATPMDAELAQLGAQLNGTYVAYGAGGGAGVVNQLEQDKNAASLGAPAAASRAAAKGTKMYRSDSWDLVDALAGGKDVKREELPPAMQGMSEGERKAWVEGKAKEREEIQNKIASVAAKRDAFLKGERAKHAGDGKAALDDALNGAIVDEAKAKGFKF